MSDEIPDHLVELEAALQRETESEKLRIDLLEEYFHHELRTHPRRIHHIAEFVRRFPRSSLGRCPFAHLSSENSHEDFETIEHVWQNLLALNPGDPEITRGLALFVAQYDGDRAIAILRRALEADPAEPEIWMELGRISPDPVLGLQCFLRARELGSSQPNLLVWIASSAIEANDFPEAERAGRELVGLVAEARQQYGDSLDWRDKGHALYERAYSAAGNRSGALALVDAIRQHAHRKHWGHITLGLLALRSGDLGSARDHLLESAAVVGEPRLSSYGPSFSLARALCEAGEWATVAEYLRRCETFWQDDVLQEWQDDVSKKVVPDFDDD